MGTGTSVRYRTWHPTDTSDLPSDLSCITISGDGGSNGGKSLRASCARWISRRQYSDGGGAALREEGNASGSVAVEGGNNGRRRLRVMGNKRC